MTKNMFPMIFIRSSLIMISLLVSILYLLHLKQTKMVLIHQMTTVVKKRKERSTLHPIQSIVSCKLVFLTHSLRMMRRYLEVLMMLILSCIKCHQSHMSKFTQVAGTDQKHVHTAFIFQGKKLCLR